MKLLNYKKDDEIRLGIKAERGVIDVKQAAADLSVDAPADMAGVMGQGTKALEKLAVIEEKATQFIQEDTLVFAPCVASPEKIICVGLNYDDHISETKMEKPQYPILFSKFNNALAAHRQKITLPKTAEKCDYEAELVVVMGKEASCVSKDEALSYVFGYTAGNDFSARDLQMRTGQWLLGKTCDGFAPIGPYLVTADGIDPNNLNIQCTLNGELRQSSITSNMIFDCADIISYASNYMTLKPGDLIFTGTPSGVIMGEPEGERHWLKPGDEVTVSIEKIGSLTNILK